MRAFVGILMSLIVTGCASGSYNRTPPAIYENKSNTKKINRSKENLWAALIPAIGKSFFTINTVDKSSGLINLSFSANPEKYVDCGSFTSTVKNAHGPRTYNINFASPEARYEVYEKGVLSQVYRKLMLEGKINLIVEKLSENTSKVTVNTRYTLIRTVIGSGAIDMNYRPIQTNQVETIGFDFNSRGVFNGGTECVATGRLEQEILDLID